MRTDPFVLTHLSIKGRFVDVALYSGILYVWKTATRLFLYDWNKLAETVPLSEYPIYMEPYPYQEIPVSADLLGAAFIRELHFEKPVTDFFLFRHSLYYSNPNALYRLPLNRKDLQRELLWQKPIQTLALSPRGHLAIGAEDGVYISESKHTLATAAQYPAFKRVEPEAADEAS